MYKQNRYTRIYHQIIQNAAGRSYPVVEKHHIIPKSLGGTNESTNIVSVSPREHFVLHKCLVRMVVDPKHRVKMRYAVWRMMNKQSRGHNRTYRITGREYAAYRVAHSQSMISNNPMHQPDVVAKRTGVCRPDQSVVASKRNVEYWASRKRPLVIRVCEHCAGEFEHIEARRFCCVSCRARFFNNLRKKEKVAEATFSDLSVAK